MNSKENMNHSPFISSKQACNYQGLGSPLLRDNYTRLNAITALLFILNRRDLAEEATIQTPAWPWAHSPASQQKLLGRDWPGGFRAAGQERGDPKPTPTTAQRLAKTPGLLSPVKKTQDSDRSKVTHPVLRERNRSFRGEPQRDRGQVPRITAFA